MTWRIYYPTEDDDHYHVVPDFGRSHELEDFYWCWCEPEPCSDEPRVIIHHEEH